MKKADKERYQMLSEMGCICCLLFEGVYSPPSIHHINGRKGNGNKETIPLCYLHHQEGSNKAEYVSRHPFKFEFEKRYGSEKELLKKVNFILGLA